MRSLGAAGLALLAAPAWAHGEKAPVSPWLEGSLALFADPACVLALLVLALWLAQGHTQRLRWPLLGAGAGLLGGALLGLGGLVLDLTLPLLAGALALGALVAWARPVPNWLRTAAAAALGLGVLLMLAPAAANPLAERLGWLAGALASTAGGLGGVLAALRALMGRQRGPVKQMLLRVGGSWLATAALLTVVLELSRRYA